MNENYHVMPNSIALELIKEWVKPGYPPLGLPFAWSQPDNEDHITVGGLYACVNGEYTVQDLIMNETRSGYNYNYELAVTLESAKQIIRLARDNGIKDLRNDKFEFNAIFSHENPSIEFAELDPAEVCLYRLAILCLNTMTEGHNLACEYLEYLGETKVNKYQIEWDIYTNDWDNELNEIIPILTSEDNVHTPFWFNDNEAYYHMDYITRGVNPDILAWINELESDYQYNHDPDYNDLIHQIFRIDVNFDYEREEILAWIAWIIDWLIKSWQCGDLTLKSDNSLDPKLNDWIKYTENQITLNLEYKEHED